MDRTLDLAKVYLEALGYFSDLTRRGVNAFLVVQSVLGLAVVFLDTRLGRGIFGLLWCASLVYFLYWYVRKAIIAGAYVAEAAYQKPNAWPDVWTSDSETVTESQEV